LSLSLRPRFLWRSSAIMASTFIRGYCKVFPSCSNQKDRLAAAAGMVAEGFALPQTDETLFLMNVVGTYLGLGPDEAEDELSKMFEASEAEEKATRIGSVVMIDYLANGKTDKHKVHLAALQKASWG
jgi:hypothetical protein